MRTILRVAISFVVGIVVMLFRVCQQSASGSDSTSTSPKSGTSTSAKRIPLRIKINDNWYNVSEGWGGTLRMSQSMEPVAYETRKPHPVLHENLYSVHDLRGNEVGKFNIGDRSYFGGVTGLEM